VGIPVYELVKRFPIKMKRHEPAINAAKLMTHEGVGLVVLVDPVDDRKVVGVVSERDIIRAIAKGVSLQEAAEKIGTLKVVTIYEDESISKAARLMLQRGIRHLVVLNRDDKLAGVISIRDLIQERKILKLLAEALDSNS